MLLIGSNGTLLLDGQRVSLPMDEMGNFLLASLSEPCQIDGASMGDIMNVFFHVQPFIQNYFIEEYHAVNALVSTLQPKKFLQRVEFSKHMVIDGDGYATILPHVEIITGDDGTKTLKDTPVVLLDEMEISGDQRLDDVELKTKFTLLEVMDCVFSEFAHIVMNNSGAYVHIWSLE